MPGGQPVQVDEPGLGAKVPGGHGVKMLAAPTVKDPMGATAQAVDRLAEA